MKANFSSEKDFIKEISPAAQRACKRYGYLPSVLIAQACLENGYGIPSYWDNQTIKDLLKNNNMIGQKAELLNSSWYDKTVWNGKSFNKNTPEVYNNKKTFIQDDFRTFDNPEQSFCDFLLFLTYASNEGYGGKPKYGKEVLSIKDPEKLIQTVLQRGYATDPAYATSVMKIVNKHSLTKYDDLKNIKASDYVPDSLKKEVNDVNKTINDITKQNLSQVPASRGNNPIEWIVIHYLGVQNADNPYLYGGGYGGHYNITMDGTIYKAADPKTAVVWHCGGGRQGYDTGSAKYFQKCTNYNSIGIENSVKFSNNTWYFTTETQESLVYLVSTLMDKYKIDLDHVIRHWDVTGKHCPAPYVENNNYKTNWTWSQFKDKVKVYRKNKGNISNYPNVPFSIKILISDLNIRKEPNGDLTGKTAKKGKNTIIKVSGDWGKLKDKSGWIYLKNPEYVTIGKTIDSNTNKSNSYTVKVEASNLNIREGAGTQYKVIGMITDKGQYTIVKEQNGWGLLKSYEKKQNGWISLKYTKKV